MADLGELIARIGLDTSALRAGVAESEGLLSGGLGKAAGIAAAAIAAIGVAAVGFGVAAAHKFADVGGEVLYLQRVAGGSAEEMSKLRFAAEETGVPIDTLGNSIRILSGHLVKNDQAATDMGIAYRDANGQLLPTNEILLRLADKFASMPNGIEKTRLATELFGRAGTAMIPILNKGRVGLAELEAEATKFGLVLSTQNIDAIRANIIAHREWHAAWEGLQVQIGAVILPLLTKLAQFMTNVLVPGIGLAAHFAQGVLAPAFSFLLDVIMRVVNTARSAWMLFMAGFSNPQAADGLTGFANLFFEFGQRVHIALDAVKHAWDIFVLGFKSPTADSTLSGWDNAFFTLGQNVKKALDAIALAWHSVVAGFSNADATKPVDGLNSAFFRLGQIVRNVFDWIAAHVEPVLSRVSDILANNFTQAVAAGAVALGALAIKAGALDGVIGTITATFEALSAVLGVVSAPVVLVVAAIAALGAAAYVAYQKIQPFHDAMDAVGRFLKTTFLAAVDGATRAWDGFITGFQNPQQRVNVTGLEAVFQRLGASLRTTFDGIRASWDLFLAGFNNADSKIDTSTLEGKIAAFGQAVRKIFDGLLPAISTALDAIANFITNSFIPALTTAFRAVQGPLGDFVRYIQEIAPQVQEAVKHIVEVIRRELTLVAGVFAAVFVAISAAWKLWGDDIARIVRNVFDIVKVYVQTGIRIIRDVINAALALINGDWGKFWDAIKDIPAANLVLVRAVVENGMKIIGNVFVAAWDGIVAATKLALGKVGDVFRALPGLILDALKALPGLLVRTGNDLMTGLFSGIATGWAAVAGWFSRLPGDIISRFVGAASWLASAGNDVMTGLWNGIASGWNNITAWFGRLPGEIGNYFSSAVSWLIGAGNSIMTGLWNGIAAGWGNIASWFGRLPGEVASWFSSAVSWLASAGNTIMTGLWNGIATGWGAITGWFSRLPGDIGSFFAAAATWLYNAGIELIKGFLNGMIAAMDRLPSIVQRFTGLDAVIRGLHDAVNLLDGAKVDITANADTTQAQQALDDLLRTLGGIVDYSHPPPPGSTTQPVTPPFASGGLTFGPSLAGEAGQELILPMNHPQRARQLLAAHGGAITGGNGAQSSITNYNLYGPIEAADPMELERQLQARARVAAMAGR